MLKLYFAKSDIENIFMRAELLTYKFIKFIVKNIQ